jgi:hypothetical protein
MPRPADSPETPRPTNLAWLLHFLSLACSLAAAPLFDGWPERSQEKWLCVELSRLIAERVSVRRIL